MEHIVQHAPANQLLPASAERFDELLEAADGDEQVARDLKAALLRHAEGDPLIAQGVREIARAERGALLQ